MGIWLQFNLLYVQHNTLVWFVDAKKDMSCQRGDIQVVVWTSMFVCWTSSWWNCSQIHIQLISHRATTHITSIHRDMTYRHRQVYTASCAEQSIWHVNKYARSKRDLHTHDHGVQAILVERVPQRVYSQFCRYACDTYNMCMHLSLSIYIYIYDIYIYIYSSKYFWFISTLASLRSK